MRSRDLADSGSKEDCVRRLVQADQKDALAGTVVVKKTSAELAEEAQEAAEAQAEEAAIAKARAVSTTARMHMQWALSPIDIAFSSRLPTLCA